MVLETLGAEAASMRSMGRARPPPASGPVAPDNLWANYKRTGTGPPLLHSTRLQHSTVQYVGFAVLNRMPFHLLQRSTVQ